MYITEILHLRHNLTQGLFSWATGAEGLAGTHFQFICFSTFSPTCFLGAVKNNYSIISHLCKELICVKSKTFGRDYTPSEEFIWQLI